MWTCVFGSELRLRCLGPGGSFLRGLCLSFLRDFYHACRSRWKEEAARIWSSFACRHGKTDESEVKKKQSVSKSFFVVKKAFGLRAARWGFYEENASSCELETNVGQFESKQAPCEGLHLLRGLWAQNREKKVANFETRRFGGS